jgi:lipoprotein NlpD
LLLQGCADMPDHRQLYVVKPQDTLYSIAWRYGLDYRDLARWNHIGSDYRISVGQTLSLAPSRSATPGRSATPSHSAAPDGSAASGRSAPSRSSPSSPAPIHSAPAVTAQAWGWPTDRFGEPRPVASGGILLSGQLGQDVRAAAAGRVVYSGTGIRGYGNLIIIKHGENLLSAYAHNRESLAHEGQEVALGQVIGHMGEGAPGAPVLYFEIRRNGKPIDPLSFLPRVK